MASARCRGMSFKWPLWHSATARCIYALKLLCRCHFMSAYVKPLSKWRQSGSAHVRHLRKAVAKAIARNRKPSSWSPRPLEGFARIAGNIGVTHYSVRGVRGGTLARYLVVISMALSHVVLILASYGDEAEHV